VVMSRSPVLRGQLLELVSLRGNLIVEPVALSLRLRRFTLHVHNLFSQGSQLAPPREQSCQTLAGPDGERPVGEHCLARCGDKAESAPGPRRQSQRRSQRVDEPMAPQEARTIGASSGLASTYWSARPMIPASPERFHPFHGARGGRHVESQKAGPTAQSAASLSRAEAKDSVCVATRNPAASRGQFLPAGRSPRRPGASRPPLRARSETGRRARHETAAALPWSPRQVPPAAAQVPPRPSFAPARRQDGPSARQAAVHRGSLLPTSGERRLSRGQLVRRLF